MSPAAERVLAWAEKLFDQERGRVRRRAARVRDGEVEAFDVESLAPQGPEGLAQAAAILGRTVSDDALVAVFSPGKIEDPRQGVHRRTGFAPGATAIIAARSRDGELVAFTLRREELGRGKTSHTRAALGEKMLSRLGDWMDAPIRWAELLPESAGLREGIARRAPSADADVAPLAAWAAMLVDRTAGLAPALERSLAGPPATILDALTLIDWLGPKLDDLGPQIEPLLDAKEEAIACRATRALIRNAPDRWRRVWALTGETQLNPPPRRPRNAPPPEPGREQEGSWIGPTPRAFSAQSALGEGAPRLGEDAAATAVEHAAERWVLPILIGLGPLARGAAPALAAQFEAAIGTSRYHVGELARALAAIGGPIACLTLERVASTNDDVAFRIGDLGDDATPALQRLLAAPLTADVQSSLLNGLGHMRTPAPELRTAVLRLVDDPDPGLQLMAIFAAGAFELDDAIAVRLATTFVRCSAAVSPFQRTLHLAADRMAPIWAARIEHESDIVALRCIEALGWTRQYGEDHVAALRALAARVGTETLRGRSAIAAAERIVDPEPMFPPNG